MSAARPRGAAAPFVPEAVVLDLDGTLLDTEAAYRGIFADAVAAFGRAVDDALYGRLVGLSSRERGPIVLSHLGADFPWGDCLRDYRARKAALLAGPVRTKPGAAELLADLAARGMPFAVATSAGRETARLALERAGLLGAVPTLVTRDDVSAGKPHPALFLLAASALGAEPARCLAVEDSAPGVAAAWAAGMRVVLVPDGVAAPPCEAADVTVVADLLSVRALLRGLLEGGPRLAASSAA